MKYQFSEHLVCVIQDDGYVYRCSRELAWLMVHHYSSQYCPKHLWKKQERQSSIVESLDCSI